jgi:hypothetical protein
MKPKLLLCLALVLGFVELSHSADWAQQAATIRMGATRAQVNAILPVWNSKQMLVVTTGSSTVESYWVSKDWVAVVSYDATGGEGSISNRTLCTVKVDEVPYPQNLESTLNLLVAFKNCQEFWQQFEIAKKIAALHNTNVLQSTILIDGLTNEDRHARANAAFVFDALGDERGFDTLQNILTDRSPRPPGELGAAPWMLKEQIREDRYYAVHVFGDLKEPRAVPILIPLLKDDEVNYIVPWSLGEIGDKRAIPPLIGTLDDKNPSMRVLAIYALEQLHAVQALPWLQTLLNDNDRSNFDGLVSVADAAREAITQLKTTP